LTDTNQKETDMQALVLSTLLFHSLGTVAMVLGMALNDCLPARRSHA
jgi:hypothetical protein